MSLVITGKAVTGTGRGAKFIALPIYKNIFERLLGSTPFFGTLNLRVTPPEAKAIKKKFSEGNKFDNLMYEGKEYGGIITIPVIIKCEDGDIEGVGVRPLLTSHDSDIIEIVSSKHLRSCLEINDGDSVTLVL